MISRLLTIFQINITTNTNRVLYYLKRLPLIGKKIPDRVFGDSDLKLTAAVVVAILSVLRCLAGKAMYIGLVIILPMLLIFKEIPKDLRPEAFVHLFFFLSFIAGTIQVSALLETNRNKYVCIKLMRFGARDFVIPTMFAKHIFYFFYTVPSVMIADVIFGAPIRQGVLLVFLVVAFRFLFEAVQLLLFDKTGMILIKKYAVQWAVIIPACIAAWLPLYFSSVWPIGRVLFSLPAVLILLAGAVIGLRYILRYQDFKRAVESTIRLEDIMVDYSKIKSEALFNSVKLKEKEFTGSSLYPGKFEKKTGYEYLNAIFFERHRKLLEAPIIRRLGIIAAVFVVMVVLSFLFPEMTKGVNLTGMLPYFVFIMYFASLGDQICKAMFYNCDISLLRYGFYREKSVILSNFMVRLKKVAFLNLMIGAAIVLAMSAYLWILNIACQPLDFLLFAVSILCLSVFFSVHHLFLYYTFQPYTTELGMKNPFFRIINMAVYLVCFGSMQLRNVPGFFTILVIGATLTYIVAALILVYRFAPKNFKVK